MEMRAVPGKEELPAGGEFGLRLSMRF